MGYWILITIGLIGPFFLIYYREGVGDLFGEADWMKHVGGVYNVIVIAAVIIFFWALAEATGTTALLFSPLKGLIPGLGEEVVEF